MVDHYETTRCAQNYANQKERHMNAFKIHSTFLFWFHLFDFFFFFLWDAF